MTQIEPADDRDVERYRTGAFSAPLPNDASAAMLSLIARIDALKAELAQAEKDRDYQRGKADKFKASIEMKIQERIVAEARAEKMREFAENCALAMSGMGPFWIDITESADVLDRIGMEAQSLLATPPAPSVQVKPAEWPTMGALEFAARLHDAFKGEWTLNDIAKRIDVFVNNEHMLRNAKEPRS